MLTAIQLRVCTITLCVALVAACTPQAPSVAPPVAQTVMPADFPEAYYRQAQGHRNILHVDSTRSLITIDVRRSGPFARLGHDHVVASRHVTGYADPQAGRADLYVPLERLTVDEPALRAEAKLDTRPSLEDIEGTRHNMLVKVLEADRFPFALIHAEYLSAEHAALRLTITLHGITRSFDVPVHIEQTGQSMAVSGHLAFKQTDFGMVPMSVLGGAIQVQDTLDLCFSIVTT